jgi:hypothetical protein
MRIHEVKRRFVGMRDNDDMTLNSKRQLTFFGCPGIAEGPDVPLSDWIEDPLPDVRDPGDWKNVEFGPDGEPVRIPHEPVPGGVVHERLSSSI